MFALLIVRDDLRIKLQGLFFLKPEVQTRGYIMVISFIGGGKLEKQEKMMSCRKSLIATTTPQSDILLVFII